MTLHVAPGNHEDYDFIESIDAVSYGWLMYKDRILLAPRGHRSPHDGRTVVWLGGAGSIDRTYRLRLEASRGHRTLWWPQEFVTDTDVEATIAGGHADVMISHDAQYPVASIGRRLIAPVDSVDVIDAHASRRKFTRAVAAIRPDLLIHGHYHFAVDDTCNQPFSNSAAGPGVRVFGLGRDGDAAHGVAILDTTILKFDYLWIGAHQNSSSR